MSVPAARLSLPPVGWLRGTTAALALFYASQVGLGLALVADSATPDKRPVLGGVVATVLMTVAVIGSLAIAFEWAFANRRRDVRAFGLARPRRLWSTLGIALVAYWVIAIIANAITVALGLNHGTTNINTHHTAPGTTAFLVLYAIVAAPWIEEVAVRGLLFSSLQRRFGLWPASVVSGFVWAAAHGVSAVLILFTAVGTLLALVRWRTGSLLPGVILHATLNTFAVSVASQSGPDAVRYALAAAALMALLVAAAWRWAPPPVPAVGR